MPHISKKNNGFTLIEALVSAAIFATVVVAVSGIFINVIKLNRETNAIRVAGDNARYITEFLSKEIRNGRLNFDASTAMSQCGTVLPATANWLYLTNVQGDLECFYLGNASQALSSTGPYLWLAKIPNGAGTVLTSQINQSYAQITSLTFNVIPANLSQAVQTGDTTNQQPEVVIQGTMVSNQDPNDIITIPFQTTVSIPEYDIAR